ncbi:hypothetical protein D9M72_200240 [compost metagenome]
MKTIAKTLAEMRKTLATPESWNGGYMAANENNSKVSVLNPDACKFCLMGAAAKALAVPGVTKSYEANRFSFVEESEVGKLLVAVIHGRGLGYETHRASDLIWMFNDQLNNRATIHQACSLEEAHAEVLDVLDEAYQHAFAAGV